MFTVEHKMAHLVPCTFVVYELFQETCNKGRGLIEAEKCLL